jgi:2-hydroxychromene-2-carboxylate isomerase
MIEFFFDCSSPWTYLAFHNIQPMAAALGVPIAWRPILVGGVFNAVNPSVYAARDNPVPAKTAYMRKDLDDWARAAGLSIVFPPRVFPVNSVKAMRACVLLEAEGKLVVFARAVFESYWSRDEDISQDDVLAGICRRIGLDPGYVAAGLSRPAVKDKLRANTDELIRRGGFGSPTMFVGGTDMYFGNDRLGLVRDAVERLQARALKSAAAGARRA